MALALNLNGATTTTIPGTPATGDRITLDNGILRLNFVYKVHATSPAQWWGDLIEWWNGAAWLVIAYGRDKPRFNVNGGGGDVACTNQLLTIITNTASTITLQTQASGSVASGTNAGKVGTLTQQWTMTTNDTRLECQQWCAFNGTIALTSNNFIEDWGCCYWTGGLGRNVTALFEHMGSTFDNNRVRPTQWYGNRGISRTFARPANKNARSYAGGMAQLLANGAFAIWTIKPSSYQNLTNNLVDTGGAGPQGGIEWQYSQGGPNSFIVSTDNAYTTVTDPFSSIIRPGHRFGNSSATTTMPQATSNTDATTTINHTWSLTVEASSLAPTAYGPLSVPLWYGLDRINYYLDLYYGRPTIGSQWQSLAALEALALPTVASTYSQYFDTTYGYQQSESQNTYKHLVSNAYALQAVLRHANFNVGNGVTDALAMADILATVIANFQQMGGAQHGALQKVWHTDTLNYTCQDTTHIASADQPHVSAFAMAEAVYALIDYYQARGNVTLTPQHVTNLLSVNQSNGGETDLTGFTSINGATLAQDLSTFYSGAASVKVTASDANFRGVAVLLSTLQAGQTYTLSAKVIGPAGQGVDAFLYSASGVPGSVIGSATTFTLTGSWQTIALVATMPASPAGNYGLRINADAAFSFNVDELQIEAGNTLHAWAVGGTPTPASVLDAAMGYLVNVQQADGGWLVEYNNANVATSTNGRIGRNYAGSSTVDLAASLYQWATLSPTASAAAKALWQSRAIRAVTYWLTSECDAHGAYEFGEDYVNYSSHACKLNARGFLRWHRLTGNPLYQEWMQLYTLLGVFLCKRIDEVINNAGTNNQNVPTAALMSTIDFSGVESGEISNGWWFWLTDALTAYPNPPAYLLWYLWAQTVQMTYAYRDSTYLVGSPRSFAYASPNTNASGFATGIDNTRFTYFASGLVQFLLSLQSLIQNSNPLILATCWEAGVASGAPLGRTVTLYNPQGTTQAATITVKGMLNRGAWLDGVVVATGASGSDLTVAVSLAAGQISTLTVR